MIDVESDVRQTLKHPHVRANALAARATKTLVAFCFLASLNSVAGETPAVRHIEIAPPAVESRVPEITAQGRQLAPQAVSALDVSADGEIITVGTMAFRHDANVWQFAPDGAIIAKRHFPPWAPMQVATLAGGN